MYIKIYSPSDTGLKNFRKRILASFYLSVCPHGTTRLPPEEFEWNFIFEFFFENVSRKVKFKLSPIIRPETEVEPEEEVVTDEEGPYILQSEVEKEIGRASCRERVSVRV
jgi:hypothetical protein